MIKNSTEHRGCEGCSHRLDNGRGDWCNMLANQPEELPCSQHDKFEDERRAVSKVYARNPALLALAIMGAIELQKVDNGESAPS